MRREKKRAKFWGFSCRTVQYLAAGIIFLLSVISLLQVENADFFTLEENYKLPGLYHFGILST
jgi:hypothetical protein